MEKYKCLSCNFSTNHKPNYERHLKTMKHKKCSTNVALCSSKETIHQCKYCKKVLKHHSSLYRHIKHYCKKNTNEKIIQDKYNQIENMQKQIDILTSKLQNQNI